MKRSIAIVVANKRPYTTAKCLDCNGKGTVKKNKGIKKPYKLKHCPDCNGSGNVLVQLKVKKES